MGTLINGKYYKNDADVPKDVFAKVSQQLAGYNIESNAQKFDRELIQPWLRDGTANPDFIKYYPKEAMQYGMIKNNQKE